MESVIERNTKGNYRKQNPQYASLRYQLHKAIERHDVQRIKQLCKELKDIPSVDVMDSNYLRVKYVRYADDSLIGTISDKENAKHDKAQFLGYLIIKGQYP